MKTVCLIKDAPALIYFVNQIHDQHDIALVIIEKPKYGKSNLLAKIKKLGVLGFIKAVKNKLIKNKVQINDYERFFADKWHTLNNKIPYLETNDINSDAVLKRLQELQPDLILDHGTSIVDNHILKTSPLALNLHWGLSPYYRGTHCTEWALINWDPKNIGVTIHKLSDEIDGGQILAQSRADINGNDTLHSINMQLTFLGTELLAQAISKLKNNEQLTFHTQDFSLGYLTYMRQWNYLLDKEIEFIEKNSLIKTMLIKPARKEELSIIEL